MAAHQQARPVFLVYAFQTRGQIHCVAHGCVVEFRLRAHIPHYCVASIDTDALVHNRFPESHPFCVKPGQLLLHADRCRAGVQCMLGIVQRRIPECHDRVADIFVERPVLFDDDIRHFRQIGVQHSDSILRPQFFRHPRKAFNVCKQCRYLPLFTAELQHRRILDKLFDHRRIDIFLEHIFDLRFLFSFRCRDVAHGACKTEEESEHRRCQAVDRTGICKSAIGEPEIAAE